jgi:hypothetical protein
VALSILVGLSLAAILYFQTSRLAFFGLLRNEPFSQWLPRSYYLQVLREGGPKERSGAVLELAKIARFRKDREALLAVCAALEDEARTVRSCAAENVDMFATHLEAEAKEAVPYLVKHLERYDLESLALPVLGVSTVGLLVSPGGKGPLLAAPALIPERTVGWGTRDDLIGALAKIGRSSPEEVVPAFIQVLRKRDARYFAAVRALAGFGPEAKDAVPVLLADLTLARKGPDHPDLWWLVSKYRRGPAEQICNSVIGENLQALKAIDPDAAAKAGLLEHLPRRGNPSPKPSP